MSAACSVCSPRAAWRFDLAFAFFVQVSFEAFSRPGCFIAAPPANTKSEAKLTAGRGTLSNFTQLRLLCLHTRPTHAMAAMASFWRHDPLVPSAHGAFQSYESCSMPRHFISSYGAPPIAETRDGTVPIGALRQLGLVLKPPSPSTSTTNPSPYALESTFEESPPQSEYPPAAWWLDSPPAADPAATALIYPLSEIVDETYSVYWTLK